MMAQSDSIAALAAALVKAQAALEPAVKDSENPFFKSKYADLGEVWRVVQAAFGPQGLAIVQVPETQENGAVSLTTMLMHSSGEWVSGTMPVRVVKDDPQGVGSGITYARRYALAAMCGVVAETDDDGEAAMGRNGRNSGSYNQPQAPAAPQVPTIGPTGVKALGALTALVAAARANDKETEWAMVMAEIGRRYGLRKAGDMTQAQAAEIEDWLKAQMPDAPADVFDGGADATRLPIQGGEPQ